MNDQTLSRYTDLTASQAYSLAFESGGKGKCFATFVKDGLITDSRILTDLGRKALLRYNQILQADGNLDADKAIVLPCLPNPKKLTGLNSAQRKLLCSMATNPGIAFKYACHVYGIEAVTRLKALGYIVGELHRASPLYLSDTGKQIILAALPGWSPT